MRYTLQNCKCMKKVIMAANTQTERRKYSDEALYNFEILLMSLIVLSFKRQKAARQLQCREKPFY